jgi:hypothetical protein
MTRVKKCNSGAVIKASFRANNNYYGHKHWHKIILKKNELFLREHFVLESSASHKKKIITFRPFLSLVFIAKHSNHMLVFYAVKLSYLAAFKTRIHECSESDFGNDSRLLVRDSSIHLTDNADIMIKLV